ncbi:MAG: T9SS type A sorting domain-containing protein, partial [Saprospiraceae bacterium]
DTLGLDGVGCLACHQQSDFQLGSNHSGTLFFDTAKVAYGPFVSPLSSPMLAATMYKPVYSTHISDAGNCAGCHSLVTETFDLGGEPTGNTFVEQATYHEWLNSIYEPQDISCQNCHMPALEGAYKLIAGFDTEERSPFYLHDLVGANTMMLKLLKENSNSLGIEATDEAFDETIDKTLQMLQQRTLNLDLSFQDRTEDTCYIALELKNKAGHKFPSGYPARRAIISLLVQNEEGDTLFHSGKMDDSYNVIAHDDLYEPHYQVITDESQAQIYEMVIADVAGNPTTVLTRADHLLKDNRLVPEGFSMSHPVYDTTQIAGQVLLDPDFNNQGSGEGSGTDMIYYHIPMYGFVEPLQITASVYYQSVPERWLEEMFAETSSEIDLFKSMYEEADRSPVLVKSVSDQIEGIESSVFEQQRFSTFVELVRLSNRSLLIKSNEKHQLSLFDLNGRLLQRWKDRKGNYEIQLPEDKGVYILQFSNEAGELQVEKVL